MHNAFNSILSTVQHHVQRVVYQGRTFISFTGGVGKFTEFILVLIVQINFVVESNQNGTQNYIFTEYYLND